jgi:aspartyl-tRNA(Asn)/glutamyl-tRNA(Gln) amidotransferase subunit A
VPALRTIVDAIAAFERGRTTAVALVEACLDAIARDGPRTNAFISVDGDAALAAAREADRDRAQGVVRGPLHGIPISLKDLIDVAGQPTTAASRVFADRVAAADAPVVTRLRGAGAILLGKTNLHEFALGTTSEESAWGAVRHPADDTRSAGGSSGGSAVAVATGMSVASIGSDTGGSIRIPAAACGVVGLKPSLGDVPTDGVVPLSRTLDHVGPLARGVQDAAWIWAVLAGRHPARLEPPAAAHVRVKLLGGYFRSPLAPDVRDAFDAAVETLRAAGIRVGTAELPAAEIVPTVYVNLVLPEAAHVHRQWLEPRADLYTPAVRTRLESGRQIPAVAYLEALAAREVLRGAVDAALEECDALLLPTLPIVAPPLGAGEIAIDPSQPGRVPVRTAMLRQTQLFNITGHPAISLPVPTGGLPVGLQLVGRLAETARLLATASACERALGMMSG